MLLSVGFVLFLYFNLVLQFICNYLNKDYSDIWVVNMNIFLVFELRMMSYLCIGLANVSHSLKPSSFFQANLSLKPSSVPLIKIIPS
jgi:hypothetical protein